MQIRPRLEAVIEDMLDGHILLDEALDEFEKLYIEKAYTRNKKRISHTAAALGIHRNTISKRVNSYRAEERKHQQNGKLRRGNRRAH
jgi:DNA-binding NtrC family response regulator